MKGAKSQMGSILTPDQKKKLADDERKATKEDHDKSRQFSKARQPVGKAAGLLSPLSLLLLFRLLLQRRQRLRHRPSSS